MLYNHGFSFKIFLMIVLGKEEDYMYDFYKFLVLKEIVA